MPKKRFKSYDKLGSTYLTSLDTRWGASSSTAHHETLTVNDLITSLRKSHVTPEQSAGATTIMLPSLPPQIQQILSIPQTPPPRIHGRDTRRFDEEGRLRPAGPPPPKSWLDKSRAERAGEVGGARQGSLFPARIDHLPYEARHKPQGHDYGSLQNMCIRRMATNWDFTSEWETNNLSYIPTRLRMDLLSNIAVHGPANSIGIDDLKAILAPPECSEDRCDFPDNDAFYRLDLSGAVGRSVSFKQLTELVESHAPAEEETEDSWETSIPRPLGPLIPHLTHLSISYPSAHIAWPDFLQFAKCIPALTHISLAHWPVPSMTPNSRNVVMTSPFGRSIQLGGTNYYSHTTDNDYREAASIMRKLATILYGLEYLDLTGCTDWAPALRWKGDGEMGVNWSTQWDKLTTLKLYSAINLSLDSSDKEFYRYVQGMRNAIGLQFIMYNGERRRAGRAKAWLQILHDNHQDYVGWWREPGEANRRRRVALDSFDSDEWTWKARKGSASHPRSGELLDMDEDVLRRSVWEQ
ncbi:hypothetical protein BJ878DRAFT_117632 [Calycina marina]|uniref:Tafazzin n=1 Tax=Calycina marina TaxID=1763456 RepID=A0A9P7Z0Q6_9HELO|nr:hypothetical protein BJ878DRAFT_117632 [Calycina marina]